MLNIKAVIFDIDDTLVQTMQCKWQALKATAKKYYNLEITDGQIRKFWGTPFHSMLPNIFSNIDSYEIIKKHDVKMSIDYPMRAHKGAIDTIKKLREHYLIAALTSSSKSLIFKDLQDAKFDLNDFYFIQTAEDTSCHKPDPKVFIPIEEKLKNKGISPKSIVYVGDGPRDHEAAKNAGFHFIAVTTGLTTADMFEKAGVKSTLIISNLSQLQKKLH